MYYIEYKRNKRYRVYTVIKTSSYVLWKNPQFLFVYFSHVTVHYTTDKTRLVGVKPLNGEGVNPIKT